MSGRKWVELVKRTRTLHQCQGCPKAIAKGRKATVLVEEGYDDEDVYWKRLTYFHHLACYYAYLGIAG